MVFFRRRESSTPALKSSTPALNDFDLELKRRRAAEAAATAAAAAEDLKEAVAENAASPTTSDLLDPADAALLVSFWASRAVQKFCVEGRNVGMIRAGRFSHDGHVLWTHWVVEIGRFAPVRDRVNPSVELYRPPKVLAAADGTLRDWRGRPLDRAATVEIGWWEWREFSGDGSSTEEFEPADLVDVLDRAVLRS